MNRRLKVAGRILKKVSGFRDRLPRTTRISRRRFPGCAAGNRPLPERNRTAKVEVEGVREPERYFALLEAAENLTRFLVDIVQLEAVALECRDLILERGRTVYDR